MASIDASIPLQVKPIELPNQMAQYANMLQMQHAMSQNDLAKYQLSSAQRSDDQQNQVNALIKQGIDFSDPKQLNQLYAYGPSGAAIAKNAQEAQYKNIEATKIKNSIAIDTLKQYQDQLAGITTPDQLKAWTIAQYTDPRTADHMKMVGGSPDPALAQIDAVSNDPVRFQDLLKQKALGMGKYLEMNKPQNISQNLGGTERIVSIPGLGGAATPVAGATANITQSANNLATNAVTMRGQNMSAATAANELGLNKAKANWEGVPVQGTPAGGGMPAQGGTPAVGLPAAPGGPNAPAVNPAAASAGATTALPLKEIQKREATYPQATMAYQSVNNNTDNLITKLEALKNHPGLSGITGVIAGRTPNLTGPARDAQTLLDNIMTSGQIGVMAALKQASATGSTGFGQLSEKEGEVLRKSQAAVSQIQNTGDFKKGIDAWIQNLKETQQFANTAYSSEYGYKNGAASAAPAAAPMYANNGKTRIVSTDGGNTWSPVGGQ